MREVRFRGKRVDNGEWVTGALFPTANGSPLICNSVMAGTPIDETAMCVACAVKEATVGQYTGMDDKNGHPIFEGDIVMKTTYQGKRPLPVTFGGGMFHCGFGGGSSTPTHRYTLEDKRIEVIGNVYDNPDLLRR